MTAADPWPNDTTRVDILERCADADRDAEEAADVVLLRLQRRQGRLVAKYAVLDEPTVRYLDVGAAP